MYILNIRLISSQLFIRFETIRYNSNVSHLALLPFYYCVPFQALKVHPFVRLRNIYAKGPLFLSFAHST